MIKFRDYIGEGIYHFLNDCLFVSPTAHLSCQCADLPDSALNNLTAVELSMNYVFIYSLLYLNSGLL